MYEGHIGPHMHSLEKEVSIVNCEAILQRLLQGNPHITESETRSINTYINEVIAKPINPYDIPTIHRIIKICNIIYNNAPNVLSPLDDDIYDRLLVSLKQQGYDYPVGAPPVQFVMNDEVNGLDRGTIDVSSGPIEVIQLVDTSMPYFQQLVNNQLPIKEDFYRDTTNSAQYKKQRSKSFESDLCGTLDKCKYVLNQDAQAVGAFTDPTVMIFERDFLSRHIQMGLVDPNNIHLLVTLKYDGISIEATVHGNQIVDACTRGDTDNGEVADLSPIFQGMRFPRANETNVSFHELYQIKFEAIITDRNLEEVSVRFGKNYANPRNAVIGLLGGLDAPRFRDYITLVPLETNMNIITDPVKSPRELEIEYLNSRFTRGIDLRSIGIHGNYQNVLYELKRIVETADKLRGYMGFQYDGIVVEYLDPRIREALGKRKSIPNYSIAIKFPPLRRVTTFTHYTYSVGQTGQITPKAHFMPVYFMGQKHDKASVHSLRKVNEYGLRAGDKVIITYNNDVMPYLVPAPIDEQPKNNTNPVEVFPDKCPACGTGLWISESGDTAYCPNFTCPERMIARMANFLAKLNVRGFSTETMRALQIHNLRDLLSAVTKAKAILGNVLGEKYIEMVKTLTTTEFYDFRVFGAIGFTGCGAEIWKKIFKASKIEEILSIPDDRLKCLASVPGIGPKTVDTIAHERKFLMDDLQILVKHFKIKPSFLTNGGSKGKVRFSGIRDQQLVDLFLSKGYDAGDGGVNKDTLILIIPMMGYMSGNVQKAFKFLSAKAGFPVNYANLLQIRQSNTAPMIMTVPEAYAFIEQQQS